MNIKLVISELAYKKVQHWVHKADKEVSGFGTTSITRDDDGSYRVYVHDAFLLDQEVGAAHTDIDAKSLGKLMHKIVANPDTRHLSLNWWWHSHVRMNTFWSGTDTETIKSIGKNGLCVASVFNQLGSIRSAVCTKAVTTVKTTAFGETTQLDVHLMDNIETTYEYTSDPRIAEWDAEFTEKVKERAYTQHTSWQEFAAKKEAEEKEGKATPSAQLVLPALAQKELYATAGLHHEDVKNHGIMGFGVADEAELLGLTEGVYRRALERNDYQELMQHEYELEKLMQVKGYM
jgi:hypothetical protein